MQGQIREERREAAQLASLTKIGLPQAVLAAVAQVPGTVLNAALDNENGNLLYGVEVKTSANEIKDVQVDADTGEVLHVDAGGDHEDEEDK